MDFQTKISTQNVYLLLIGFTIVDIFSIIIATNYNLSGKSPRITGKLIYSYKSNVPFYYEYLKKNINRKTQRKEK